MAAAQTLAFQTRGFGAASPSPSRCADARRCQLPRRQCASRRAAVCAAAAPAKEYHVLVKADIPVHLPRPDFLKQMFRWAVQYAQPDRDESPNRPAMRVEVIDISPTLSIGFTIAFLKYTDAGALEPAIEYECLMDEEVVGGFDMVGMDKDGFPVLQTMDGESKTVKGKYFLVRRDKTTPVPEDFVQPTKLLLSEMMEAVNKYYSFGSPFSEEF